MKQYSAKPEKADPDSPFAALSKLKETMESQDEKQEGTNG